MLVMVHFSSISRSLGGGGGMGEFIQKKVIVSPLLGWFNPPKKGRVTQKKVGINHSRGLGRLSPLVRGGVVVSAKACTHARARTHTQLLQPREIAKHMLLPIAIAACS